MSKKVSGGKATMTIEQLKQQVAAFTKESGGKDVKDLELGGEQMSKSERKRMNALKNEQLKFTELEAKFYEELHQLECKYNKLYEPIFEKRRQIVTGEHEPTDEEGKWTLDELDNKENAEPEQTGSDKEAKGIKNFWLETLQAVRMTSELVAEVDDAILAYLQDIKVKYFDQKPYGYTLEFHFAENPYFTNKVLTKTYELKIEVDNKDPFSFEGPDLSKVTGCKIDWKPGMNVTVKMIKKKIKSKNKKAPPKVISKEEKQDSFFNFFETPKQGGASGDEVAVVGAGRKGNSKSMSSNDDLDEDDYDEDNDDILMFADFEIAQQIREKVIPKAVLYWSGELDDLDDEYDDYDEDEDDEEEGDEDEDNEEDEEDEDDDEDDDEDEGKKGGKGKQVAKHGKAAGGKGKGGKAGGTEATPSECKQN